MDPKLDGVAVYIYWLLVSDYLPIESPWCLFSEGASMASDCLPVVAPLGPQASEGNCPYSVENSLTKSFLGNLVCFKFKTCNHDLRNSLKSTVDNPNFRLRRCLEGDPWYLGFLGAVRSLSRAKINTRTRHSARCSTVLILGTSRMGSKTCHLYSRCRSLHRFRTLNAAHSQQLCSACGPHVPINKMS